MSCMRRSMKICRYLIVLNFVYDMIVYRLFIGNSSSDYYYTKIAKAAIDNGEQLEELSTGGEWYPPLVRTKHVRAVRVKE